VKVLYERWGERFRDPVVALTADQDWAPEWATERLLDFLDAADMPVHVFVTNDSPALEGTQRRQVSLGAHPNFLSGSTHGSTPEEVIDTCRSLVPNTRTVRSHVHAENSHILQLLIEAGFDTDSNLSLFLQPGILPLIHSTGILRLPVFLDDDSLLLWDRTGTLDLAPAKRALVTPGLKILNFHPALFAINCPSAEYYRTHRDELYGTTAPMRPFEGRGLATVLEELIQWLRATGHTIFPFPEVVSDCWRDLDALEEGTLYGWGKDRSQLRR
jgi:hypothetical protein